MNECLRTPERKSTAEDTTEVLFDNQYILLGLHTRVRLKGYLEIAASPMPTPAWAQQHMTAWHTLHSLLAAQQVGKCPSLLGSLVALSLL